MGKKCLVIFFITAFIIPIAIFGCKGKVEQAPEQLTEASGSPIDITQGQAITEPAETVATETIPPTASPQVAAKAVPAPQAGEIDRNREIQKALKNAGFYAGAIDGKIGPKTKKAIEEFQQAKALKVDGKVGPKTWAELEKYLNQ